jgi:hypothetical protein
LLLAGKVWPRYRDSLLEMKRSADWCAHSVWGAAAFFATFGLPYAQKMAKLHTCNVLWPKRAT